MTKDLDPHIAYIQVTYVLPYFDDKELLDRRTDFERNDNVKRFVYHSPFTKSGKAHAQQITDQWMRKTVLTSKKQKMGLEKKLELDFSVIGKSSPLLRTIVLFELKSSHYEIDTK